MKRLAATFLLLLLCMPAHAQPVADIIFDGGKQLAKIPWTSQADIARSPFGVSAGDDGPKQPGEPPAGVDPSSYFPTARNFRTEHYWGAGIYTHGGNARQLDCISANNFIGSRVGSSDTEIRGCFFANNRDADLFITNGASNCQSTQDHCFGARIACYNEGGGGFRAVNDTYADALVGYYGGVKGEGSGQTSIENTLFQHNSVCDCVFLAWACRLNNCTVNLQRDVNENRVLAIPGLMTLTGKSGIYLGGPEGSISNCDLSALNWWHPANTASGKPATLVTVAADYCQIVNTRLVDADAIDGTIGILMLDKCRDLHIDCSVRGFTQPADRLLVCHGAPQGLDVTFRIPGIVKPIDGYINIAAGWSGSITLVDTTNGKVVNLAEGKSIPAAKSLSKSASQSRSSSATRRSASFRRWHKGRLRSR